MMIFFQHVATNELLYVVANTCRRLTLLDISYSHKVSSYVIKCYHHHYHHLCHHHHYHHPKVTDIGLVHLCGVLSGTSRTLQVLPSRKVSVIIVIDDGCICSFDYSEQWFDMIMIMTEIVFWLQRATGKQYYHNKVMKLIGMILMLTEIFISASTCGLSLPARALL